jgi:hypothetical protein
LTEKQKRASIVLNLQVRCIMKTTLLVTLVAVSTAFAGERQVLSVKNKAVNLDLSPVLTANQPLPTLKTYNGKKVLHGQVDSGVKISTPVLETGVGIGTLNVGGDTIGVSIGQKTGVNLGPLAVSQELPSVGVGSNANKDGWLGLSYNKGKLSLTVPLIKVGLPLPNVSLKKKE